MEEKKFCKFCGKEIDKSSIVCPKCGRQLQVVKKTDEKEKNETTNIPTDNQPKFYFPSHMMSCCNPRLIASYDIVKHLSFLFLSF